MGCSNSMDLYQPKSFRGKTVIWLLGGGPGAPKHQLAQFLVSQFKFKYLSALDLIKFQEKTSSPQSNEIRKCIQNKQQFSSELIMKILKRSMALFGPRKYLIEGFPRSQTDLKQLNSLGVKFLQVQILGFINIDLAQAQMKKAGIKTLSELRKQATKQELQKEVRTIIQNYRSKLRPVLQYYKQSNKLINIEFYNQDVNQLNKLVQKQLSQRDLTPVQFVPIHFLHGNDIKEIQVFSIKLARRFGLLSWSLKELIQEAKAKPEKKKQASKPLQTISQDFIVDLIARRIQKYNYKDQFLLWGYPRTQQDLKALRVHFLKEVQFASFSCCLHTPVTQSQKQLFQTIQSHLQNFEHTPSLIINSNDDSYEQIEKHISKVVNTPKKSGKLLVITCQGKQGQNNPLSKANNITYLEFKTLLKKQVSKGDLYSQLIQSCEALNKPIPAILATSIVISALRESQEQQIDEVQKVVAVRGYPQNLQQVKTLFARCPQIQKLGCIFYKSKITKQEKPSQFQSIRKVLETGCDLFQRFSDKNTTEDYRIFIDKFDRQ